jgi:hypothetical protein
VFFLQKPASAGLRCSACVAPRVPHIYVPLALPVRPPIDHEFRSVLRPVPLNAHHGCLAPPRATTSAAPNRNASAHSRLDTPATASRRTGTKSRKNVPTGAFSCPVLARFRNSIAGEHCALTSAALMSFPESYFAGLLLLLPNWQQAQESARPPPEFPVDIDALREAGLTDIDLRTLIAGGFVQCVGKPFGRRRRRRARGQSPRTSGFVLTEAGSIVLETHIARASVVIR